MHTELSNEGTNTYSYYQPILSQGALFLKQINYPLTSLVCIPVSYSQTSFMEQKYFMYTNIFFYKTSQRQLAI